MLVMSDELLTVEEAAQKLRMSKYTIQRYINTGKLEGVRVGGRWRVRPEAIERFIARNIKPEDK